MPPVDLAVLVPMSECLETDYHSDEYRRLWVILAEARNVVARPFRHTLRVSATATVVGRQALIPSGKPRKCRMLF